MAATSDKSINEYRVLSADEIGTLADKIISNSKKVQDQVAALKEGSHTWENTVLALSLDESEGTILSNHCTFPAYVSTDAKIRDASVAATKKLEEFEIESNMREDVYNSLLAYKNKGDKLGPEESRLLSKFIESFERNGLALDKSSGKREQLLQKKKRVSELCIEFQKNLTEDTTSLKFTLDQLQGMPEDFISNLAKDPADPNLYIVTLKYPDRFPIFEQCKVASTRRAMELASSRQCMDANVPILEEVIQLRHEMALLLNKPTHADFILDIRMAKTNKNVLSFLSDLRDLVIPFALPELEKLRDLKRKEEGTLSDNKPTKIYSWDWRYYNKKLLVEEYQVDEEAIKQYFPLETVTAGLLFIYEKILNLRFELQKEIPGGASTNSWHEDVSLYAVYDRDSNQFIGSFYLDLFPRDGKYGHAAAFPLTPTFIDEHHQRRFPCAAMVANFTKPGKDGSKPSLLKHDEVVTYFHEFGHIMHNICSVVKYARFSGTAVERDFVEAPSQMLENWCYEDEVLEILSGHYLNKGEKLPKNLRENIVKAKNVNTGLLNLRQIFFGMFDNKIHTSPKTNTAELWKQLRKEVTLIEEDEEAAKEGGNPAGSFGHLVGGYDAQYYGYLYSEVFSADMYQMFKEGGGVMDEALGKKYREIILGRGGSVDSIDSLREFLGREPNNKAFLEHLGLVKQSK